MPVRQHMPRSCQHEGSAVLGSEPVVSLARSDVAFISSTPKFRMPVQVDLGLTVEAALQLLVPIHPPLQAPAALV